MVIKLLKCGKYADELHFKFYLNVITLHLNVNSHMWLMATTSDSAATEDYEQYVTLGRV